MSINIFEECVNANEHFSSNSRFQSFSKHSSLNNFLQPYQHKLDCNQQLSQEDIANIAKKIHLDQVFNDGNHRTAIFMIYFLNIQQGIVLGAKPYFLFGACEYLDDKLAKGITEENNRILQAIESRTFRKISLDKIEEEIEKMLINVKALPDVMQHIRENLSPSPRKIEADSLRHSPFSKAGTTEQIKNYKTVLSPVFNRSPSSVAMANLSPLTSPRKSGNTITKSPVMASQRFELTPPLFFSKEPPVETIRTKVVSAKSSPNTSLTQLK